MSKAMLSRLAKLEQAMLPPDEPPTVVYINCVNGAKDKGGTSELVMAVIAGNATAKRAGDTLHREPGETEDAFRGRVQARCRELHGLSVEVDLHG